MVEITVWQSIELKKICIFGVKYFSCTLSNDIKHVAPITKNALKLALMGYAKVL